MRRATRGRLHAFKQVWGLSDTPTPVTSGIVITRVALVPHPPLLVPELAGDAAAETAGLRDAAIAAARWLTEETKDWLAVGAWPSPSVYSGAVGGSFAGFGVDVPVCLTSDVAATTTSLPLPVLVAGWLRSVAGAASVRVQLVSDRTPTAECIALGSRLPGRGVLILGDGCTTHGPKAPGGQDDRAARFDDDVAAALASADADALAALDPAVAVQLGAAGRAAWQVAAGIISAGQWRGRSLYTGSPFGVGYHVAVWERL